MNIENPIFQSTSEVVAPIKDGNRLVDSMRPKRGHKLFKINIQTLIISEVTEFDETAVDMKGNKMKKVLVEPNHLYESRLNYENAKDAFAKRLRILEALGYIQKIKTDE